jgi:hypothetical protein
MRAVRIIAAILYVNGVMILSPSLPSTLADHEYSSLPSVIQGKFESLAGAEYDDWNNWLVVEGFVQQLDFFRRALVFQ